MDNLWASAAHRDLRLELLERLLDRVNQYRAASEMQDDRRIGRLNRWTPTSLVHKGRKDWEELQKVYTTPSTAKG